MGFNMKVSIFHMMYIGVVRALKVRCERGVEL